MNIIKDGNYKFRGMYSADMPSNDGYREQESVKHVYIKLDNAVILFEENPDDGYRSYCNESLVTDVPSEVKFNLEEYPVPCYVKNLDVWGDDFGSGRFRGIGIYTDETCRVELAKFGTGNSDDYYPCCVQWINIPAINSHLADHHLIGE